MVNGQFGITGIGVLNVLSPCGIICAEQIAVSGNSIMNNFMLYTALLVLSFLIGWKIWPANESA